jgi:hypothetical protein
MIGVLEYAPTFFGGPDPQAAFLRRAGELLEPDGALLIAIENKIGLKYICGAPEDHTSVVYDSIYDYPDFKGVRTFTRKELAEVLRSAGFDSIEWFYPLPDYKFPHYVYSDSVAPRDSNRVWDVCAQKAVGNHREIISEKLFGRTLARAGLFHEFANSFLVVARRNPVPSTSVRCLKFTGDNQARKPQFKMESLLLETNGERVLLKQPVTTEAAEFVHVIAEREQGAVKYFGSAAKVVTGVIENDAIRYPFLPFPTMEEAVVERLRLGAVEEADTMLKDYCQFVRNLPRSRVYPEAFLASLGIPSGGFAEKPVCLNAGPIDLIPANILIAPDCWHLLDHEWFFDFPVPVDYVLYRGFASLITNVQNFIQANARENPVVLVSGHGNNRTYMPMRWLRMIDGSPIPLRTMSYWNWCFQAQVLQTRAPHRTRLRSNPRAIYNVTPLSTAIAGRLTRRINHERLRGGKLIRRLKTQVNNLLLKLAR